MRFVIVLISLVGDLAFFVIALFIRSGFAARRGFLLPLPL